MLHPSISQALAKLRPTLHGGPGSKFLGTNLNSFEANWILELDTALECSLHLGSNYKLYFLAFFFGLNQLIFPPKWCHAGLALICHFLVLDSHLKAMGSIYGSHPIGLPYFIGPWTLDTHLSGPKTYSECEPRLCPKRISGPSCFWWSIKFLMLHYFSAHTFDNCLWICLLMWLNCPFDCGQWQV